MVGEKVGFSVGLVVLIKLWWAQIKLRERERGRDRDSEQQRAITHPPHTRTLRTVMSDVSA